jgi:LytS/YehU family sensor histidine kinase
MYDDPVAADTMVARLSELLRRALDTAERQEVPLGVELDLLDHYLALLEARFGDEFVCTREVEPAAAAAMVPSLLLQPLVENAVRHGSLARSGRGRVAVRIGRDGNRLVVRVDDDGPGVPAGRDVLNEGTGLGATAERLRLLYGDAHALEAGNRDGGGFRVSVRLPWRETPAGDVGAADLSDEVAPAPTPREMAHARAHRR